MNKFICLLLFSYLNCTLIQANDNCGRTAIINYQQVLIDTGPNEKGEGLKLYLEKDELAKRYFDIYQENTKLQFKKAIPGTLGLSMMLAGAIVTNNTWKTTLLATGGVTIILTIFFSRFFDEANEENLIRSIEEYNKRNMPKIEYPHSDSLSIGHLQKFHTPFFVGFSRSF